jgi:hypothetical protein
MAEKYRAGASLPQLAREYGGSHIAVRKALLRHGVETRKPGRAAWRHFTPDEQAEIIRAWHSGESQSSIAKRIGVTQPIVSKFLISKDIEPVNRPYNLRGEQHPFWRGGRIMLHGYPAVKVGSNDPMASMRIHNGYVLEHRLVMARALGRPLSRRETVHHINGDRTDNRLENLQLRQGLHGKGVVMTCRDCGSHNVEAAVLK